MAVRRYKHIPVDTLPRYPGNYFQAVLDEGESQGLAWKIQRFEKEVVSHSHADGSRLCLMVTNRHREHPMEAIPTLKELPPVAKVRAHELNGPEPNTTNTFENPAAVSISKRQLASLPDHYSFPAHSLTALAVELR